MDKEWKFQIGGSSKDTSLDLASRPTQNPDGPSSVLRKITLLFAVSTFLYFAYVWTHYDDFHLIYFFYFQFTWLIHELGHVMFMPFGWFLLVLGGTITQIGVPTLIVWYCYKQKSYILASYGFFFVSDAVLDMAHYASDAQTRALPRAGLTLAKAGPEDHDWYEIFSMLHVLEYTKTISFCMYVIGWSIMVYALYACYKYSHAPVERSV